MPGKKHIPTSTLLAAASIENN